MTQSPEPILYVTPPVARAKAQERRRRILFWSILGTVGVVVLLIVASTIVFYVFLSRAGLLEFSFDSRLGSQVVTQILDGTLKPDTRGVVALPPALKSASMNGRAYVTVNPAGTTWVLFETWQGKGMNLRGYLYHSAPDPAVIPATVQVIGPDPLGPRGTAMFNYNVDGKERAGWYRISWDLD